MKKSLTYNYDIVLQNNVIIYTPYYQYLSIKKTIQVFMKPIFKLCIFF